MLIYLFIYLSSYRNYSNQNLSRRSNPLEEVEGSLQFEWKRFYVPWVTYLLEKKAIDTFL